MFHKHKWKKIVETYAPPVTEAFEGRGFNVEKLTMGQTTILWECQDKDCQKLRKEEMLGKIQ